jgi:light-regulated signal transduction histidine kinase (bacteriophytochrome)
MPAFYGRFLNGVRRGHLDERLEFSFGFDMDAPVRVLVRMTGSRMPDRYWITVLPPEQLSANWHEGARSAVMIRSRSLPEAGADYMDKDFCAKEPIHVPGSIQPQGFLLAADPTTLEVTACSANATGLFGQPVAAILGRTLAALFGDDIAARLRASSPDNIKGETPWRTGLQVDGRRFNAAFHVHGGNLIAELEEDASPDDFRAPAHANIQRTVSRLRDALGVPDLCRFMVEDVRGLTGFERVLIYRFDEDWNGEAIGESAVADMEPLKGLRFPSSDIPAQARDLYTRNRIRFVTDRDYAPIPLIASAGSKCPMVDLTYARFRSVSPVHLEYQRNLGVNGSMSASIMVGDRLWGLLIGHHRQPHYVSAETQAAVQGLADVFALRIIELESQSVWDDQQRHLEVQSRLLCQMAGSDHWATAITGEDATILDLFDATGAAVVSDREVNAIGDAPPPADILALADWMRMVNFEGRIFRTDNLLRSYPPANAYKDIVSGVLAASVCEERRDLLLWFRPEVTRTVTWGGDPNQPAQENPAGGILPRRSFERWVEEKTGYSDPWAEWHKGIANTLAGAIQDVILRHGRKVRDLRNKQEALSEALATAERLLREKDLLVREIDHRVKNSLQIVASVLQMQGRAVRDAEARQALADSYGRVMSVARVHHSLYGSEDAKMVDLGQTIRALCDDLETMAGRQGNLAVTIEPGILVPSDTGLSLAMVATELITNAFKYGCPPRGDCQVSVTMEKAGAEGVRLSVSDQGPGLPADWHKRESFGLGMRLVKILLDRIHARLEFSSNPGATFTALVDG